MSACEGLPGILGFLLQMITTDEDVVSIDTELYSKLGVLVNDRDYHMHMIVQGFCVSVYIWKITWSALHRENFLEEWREERS